MYQVLIVEDDPDLLEIASYAFDQEGIDIIQAKDGYQGLELIETRSFDAIILDVVLPKMNGAQLLPHIRTSRFNHKTPVLIVSGYLDDKAALNLKNLGATEIIAKPHDFWALAHRIRARIAENKVRPTAS